jgi:hypothetical protein
MNRHIDALFGESIDWSLISTHLPDMLRVALSIKAGKITPSALLRPLAVVLLVLTLDFWLHRANKPVLPTKAGKKDGMGICSPEPLQSAGARLRRLLPRAHAVGHRRQ